MCGTDAHRFPAVAHAPLALDDRFIDASRRHVVRAGEIAVQKALVVAHVLVALRAVVQNKNLTVFGGVHGARVDVHIRVDLDAT